MSNFIKDEEWGSYWEWELNRWIEPYFNHQLYIKNQILSFSSLRSSDIYPKKKDWWRFDTLYHVYDLDNPNPIKQVKFEIKTDKYDNTGNVCIEKKCSNKLSGVFHTESDFFIYYMPRHLEHNLYLIKPKEFSKLMEKFNDKLRNIGDGKRAESYIIDKNEFDEFIKETKCGKIFTVNLPIPERFGVVKFNEETKTKYTSDKLKEYEDPFKW